ncbi:DNA topoisomerase IV subunit A [Mycoplasma sp. Mirounga ES2805-ORL]|uniref:DNA topoisomerase IV subunit A n=1 Tax=Mycoplasma sp. Mirounga ES2805-ORL TaxID=754514 RepID=UPI00197C157D|nr:DNA topoisomerase IV subunit A [Mycoplasma sp. Mirounga ES2805-ORL]QSF13408.1 DNA topoisomerase IV subunit A [Mycoplasma sp. Mirounga ES2805-ORL]
MDKKKQQKLDDFITKIVNENLDSIMADRFSRYSKYIIQQRALPDARDGLKPVQRRILYSMSELGLQHNKPFKKSARVVGDVIGKYHPHGDSSIYEAMVRMAQDWKMGYTLLEMHGNVGSIDDDPAAAMRYTEVRLAEISEVLLNDLKKNTVSFAPNFDDSEKEPTVLPSLIPNLLLNGAKGIASGFATEMPPHNLNEILDAAIAKIKNPDIEFKKLMNYVKGPDFPTGGVIYGQKGIYEAFERGRGRVTLVSKYKVFEDKNNKFIEITEIPYGVVKSKLIHSIDLLIVNNSISGLNEIKDQSDRNGISILITLDKNASEEHIINYLLQKTEMQVYYSYNNVAIVNSSPKLMNLNQLLGTYITHAKEVKTKTLQFDLAKYKARLEIVLGFLKVAEITDEVISVIRKSENSKAGVIENLIKEFDFTQNQATAIAELRLYKLSKTDKEAFLKEKSELEENIKLCELLLNDSSEFDKYLINILKDIKKQFGRPRRTEIIEEDIKISYSEAELVKDEEVYLGVTKHGYIKMFSPKVFDSNNISSYGIKEEDKLISITRANTTNNVLIFTNLGNYAMIPLYKIDESKWKDFGLHLSDFVQLEAGEEVVSSLIVSDFNELKYICTFTKMGQGKRTILKDFEVARPNKTFTAMKLKTGDKLLGAKYSNGMKDVLLVTAKGLASLYSENDVQIYSTKSSGTKSCNLLSDDEIVAFALTEYGDTITMLANDKYIKRINVSNIKKVSRKNLGKQLFNQMKIKPYIVTDIEPTNTEDFIYVHNEENELLMERIVNYDITTPMEGFSKIKIQNIVNTTIKTNINVESGNDPEVNEEKNFEDKFTSKLEKEEEIFERAEKEVDSVLDLDVDDLLKKLNLS